MNAIAVLHIAHCTLHIGYSDSTSAGDLGVDRKVAGSILRPTTKVFEFSLLRPLPSNVYY